MKTMKRTVIYMIFMSCALTVGAQEEGGVKKERSLTLDECVSLAMKQNYDVLQAGKSVERSKLMQGTAWDVGKTDLSLSQDPTSGGSPDNSLSLSQTIDFPTVYISRRKHLKAETSAEAAKMEMTQKTVEADVSSAYYRIVYEEERLRIFALQDSLLQRFYGIAEKRYRAGETRQLEVLSAERLLGECRAEKASAESDAEEARLSLCRLIGSSEPVVPADKVLRPVSFVTGQGFNYLSTPEGRYADKCVEVADKAVAVAKNGYAPSLSLSLRNQLVLSSWNPYHQDRSRFDGGNFMGFEVGVGIPLFYGATRAKVKAAKKEREMAELELKAQGQRREKEYDALLSRINASRVRVEYYTEKGLQTAEKQVSLAALEYEAGEIGYIEYVDILRQHLDERLKAASAISEYNETVVELKRMMPY